MTEADLTVTYRPDEEYTEQDWEVFSKWIKGVLFVSTPTITFTKKDGTERVMRCTLREDMLPAREINENVAPRKQNVNSVAVYDLDANGWRSFTLKSVKCVSFAIDRD